MANIITVDSSYRKFLGHPDYTTFAITTLEITHSSFSKIKLANRITKSTVFTKEDNVPARYQPADFELDLPTTEGTTQRRLRLAVSDGDKRLYLSLKNIPFVDRNNVKFFIRIYLSSDLNTPIMPVVVMYLSLVSPIDQKLALEIVPIGLSQLTAGEIFDITRFPQLALMEY